MKLCRHLFNGSRVVTHGQTDREKLIWKYLQLSVAIASISDRCHFLRVSFSSVPVTRVKTHPSTFPVTLLVSLQSFVYINISKPIFGFKAILPNILATVSIVFYCLYLFTV